MSFAFIDSAVGAALLGVDPAFVMQGRGADLGAQGAGVVTWDAQGERPEKATRLGSRVLSFGGLKTEIPVYRFSARGKRQVETWPCITFEVVGVEFDPSRYTWRADQFRDAVPESLRYVRLSGGKEIVGPALRRHRDNPEPFNVIVEVRTWSRSPDGTEGLAMSRAILETFPARGQVKAVQEDGSAHRWEMILRSVFNIDDDEPTLANPRQRGSSWVFTYVVETVLDNTLVTEIRRTLTSPVEFETVLKK